MARTKSNKSKGSTIINTISKIQLNSLVVFSERTQLSNYSFTDKLVNLHNLTIFTNDAYCENHLASLSAILMRLQTIFSL